VEEEASCSRTQRLRLVATSLIGWSVAVDASALHRVGDDTRLLLASALAGGGAGALVAWVLTNRALVLVAGALIGMAPTFLKASAYFTSGY
jgi:hypothetical protein